MISNLLDALWPARIWRRMTRQNDEMVRRVTGGATPDHYREYTRRYRALVAEMQRLHAPI